MMLKQGLLLLLAGYQKYVRRYFPHVCRFEPSCSEYAKLALEKYGFWQGACMALARIFSCHPFSRKAGFDPLA